MSKNLNVCVLILALSLCSSDVFATATYLATGSATSVSSFGLLLPPTVEASDTSFSLEYSLDETQAPTDYSTDEDITFRVDTFSGFVGAEIAFSGTGGEVDFSSSLPNFFSWRYEIGSSTSLTLQGIAADLISVSDIVIDVSVPAELVPSVIDSREFPVEQSVGTNGVWFFAAGGPAAGIVIDGTIDSVVLLSGPSDSDMGDGGMGDGGMGDGGLGDGDDSMVDGGGKGAVPEPSSVMIWLTLGALVMSRRRNKRLAFKRAS